MASAYFTSRDGIRLARARFAFWWYLIGPEGRRRSERIAVALKRWYGLGLPAAPRKARR